MPKSADHAYLQHTLVPVPEAKGERSGELHRDVMRPLAIPRVHRSFKPKTTERRLEVLEQELHDSHRLSHPNYQLSTAQLSRQALEGTVAGNRDSGDRAISTHGTVRELVELLLKSQKELHASDIELVVSLALQVEAPSNRAGETHFVRRIDPNSEALFEGQVGVGLKPGPEIDLTSLALLTTSYDTLAGKLFGTQNDSPSSYVPRPYELPVNGFHKAQNREEIEAFLAQEWRRQEELVLLHLVNDGPCGEYEISRALFMKPELVQKATQRLLEKGEVAGEEATGAIISKLGEEEAQALQERAAKIQKVPLVDERPSVTESLALALRTLGFERATVVIIPGKHAGAAGVSWKVYY